MCLFLISIFSIQAQNLFRNGDFKNGTDGWNLGGFTLGGDSSYPYIQTGYVSSYGFARVSTDGQEITDVGGKTYIFSFWASGLNANGMNANVLPYTEDGTYVTIPELNYNTFTFEEVGNANGWKKFQAEITFPEEVYKIKQFGITLSDKSYKKISEISMVELKKIEDLEVSSVYQREALITWATSTSTTSYTVQVGNASPTTVTESSYLITGLEPGSTTTIVVSAEGFSPTEIVAETESLTTSQSDRIPYVKFMNDEASTSFYPFIFDSTNPPMEVKVFLDGTELTAGENGYYTLTVGDNKNLKVTFKDGTQAYELIYTISVR